jgi:hypothetical protein
VTTPAARSVTAAAVVDIGGVSVELRASDPARSTAMTELFERLPAADRSPVASVAFLSDEGRCPEREPDEEHADLVLWRRRGDDPHDLVLAHASGLTVTIDGPDAAVGGDCESLGVGFRRLFPLALSPILALHDRILLHAGGLAGPAGAFVVVGPTGSGKSTLVLAGARAGWACLADDLVVLRLAPEPAPGPALGLEATGVPRLLAAPADVLSDVAESTALADDDRSRCLVPGVRFAPGWFPVVGTLVVGHAPRVPGTLGRVSSSDTMAATIGSFHSAGDPALLRRASPHLGVLARLPAWRLLHGCEPHSRLAGAAALLGQASAELIDAGS